MSEAAERVGPFASGVRGGALGLGAGVTALGGDVAEGLRLKPAAAALRQYSDDLSLRASRYATPSYEDVGAGRVGLDEYLASGLGQALPSYALTLGGGVAGGLLRRRAGMVAGAYGAGALGEAGETASTLRQDPVTAALPVADRLKAAAARGVVGGALEAAVPAALGLGAARTAVGGALGGYLAEGATEAAQQRLGQKIHGSLNPQRDTQHDNRELIDSFILGGLPGGIHGGVSGGARQISDLTRRAMPELTPAQRFALGDLDPALRGATPEETARNIEASIPAREAQRRAFAEQYGLNPDAPEAEVRAFVATKEAKDRLKGALEGFTKGRKLNAQSPDPELYRILIENLTPEAKENPEVAGKLREITNAIVDPLKDDKATMDEVARWKNDPLFAELFKDPAATLGMMAKAADAKNIVKKLEGSSSAERDARTKGSFLQKSLVRPVTKDELRDLGRFIDGYVGGREVRASRNQVLVELSRYFGTPEVSQAVLDVYEGQRRGIEKELGEERKAPVLAEEDGDAPLRKDELKEDPHQVLYKDPKYATPFKRGEAPKDRGRVMSMLEYAEENDLDLDAEARKITDRLKARIGHKNEDSKRAQAELDALQTSVSDRGRVLRGVKALLAQHEVVELPAQAANDLQASDIDLRAMRQRLDRRGKQGGEGTTITFYTNDGKKFALSAESMWKAWAAKRVDRGSEEDTDYREHIKRNFLGALSAVLNRPEVSSFKDEIDTDTGEFFTRLPKGLVIDSETGLTSDDFYKEPKAATEKGDAAKVKPVSILEKEVFGEEPVRFDEFLKKLEDHALQDKENLERVLDNFDQLVERIAPRTRHAASRLAAQRRAYDKDRKLKDTVKAMEAAYGTLRGRLNDVRALRRRLEVELRALERDEHDREGVVDTTEIDRGAEGARFYDEETGEGLAPRVRPSRPAVEAAEGPLTRRGTYDEEGREILTPETKKAVQRLVSGFEATPANLARVRRAQSVGALMEVQRLAFEDMTDDNAKLYNAAKDRISELIKGPDPKARAAHRAEQRRLDEGVKRAAEAAKGAKRAIGEKARRMGALVEGATRFKDLAPPEKAVLGALVNEKGYLEPGAPRFITREYVRANKDKVFLFGDNLQQSGLGGQAAAMRNEPNAVGIPTKKAPSMGPGSFFSDAELESNKKAIDAAIAKIPAGKSVVIPEDGLGTGRAQLKERAPKTYAYLEQKLAELKGREFNAMAAVQRMYDERGLAEPKIAEPQAKSFDKELRAAKVEEFGLEKEGGKPNVGTEQPKKGTDRLDKIEIKKTKGDDEGATRRAEHEADRVKSRKLNAQNSQNLAAAAALSADEQKAIVDEAVKMLGPKIRVAFGKIMLNGKEVTGEFTDAGGIETIQLALNMAAPQANEVLYHETAHAFMKRLLSKDKAMRATRELLMDVAENGLVLHRLRTLLAGHPDALKQIETDREERLAYMFQFWAVGKLTLPQAPRTLFQKIASFLREVLGIVSQYQKAEAVLAALHAGKFADPDLIGPVLADMRVETFSDKAERVAGPLLGISRKVLDGATDQLRSYKVPALNELADLFHQDVAHEGQGLGMIQRRSRMTGVFLNRFSDILKDTTAEERSEVRRALQSMDISGLRMPALRTAERIKALLKDMHKYMEEAGVKRFDMKTKTWEDLGEVKDYFPRVFDKEIIRNNQEEFTKLIMAEGGLSAYEAGEVVNNILHSPGDPALAENEHHVGYTPYAKAVNQRKLFFIRKNNAAKFVKFQSADLTEVVHTYIHQATHRAESARAFDNAGEVIQQKMREAHQQGLSEEDTKHVARTVMALEGTLGWNMNPLLRDVNSGLIVYQNLVLLPFAIFASLIDPLGIAVRSGDMKDAWGAFKRGMKGIVGMSKDMDEEMAKTMGLIDEQNMLENYGNLYSGLYMSKWLKNVNTKFFRWNGMEAWNRNMRVSAMVAAQRFIIRNRTHDRYMKELGLEAADVKELPDGRLDMTSPKVQEAVFKFVDGGVLRPQAAHRPVWASDPHWALVSHLKQFTFSFHNVILKRVAHEVKNGSHMHLAIYAGFVPFMIAADLVRGGLTGLGPKAGWDMLDYLSYGVERAGVLGKGNFAVDALQDAMHGSTPGTTFAGPTAGHAADVVQTLAGRQGWESLFYRSIPAGPLVKAVAS